MDNNYISAIRRGRNHNYRWMAIWTLVGGLILLPMKVYATQPDLVQVGATAVVATTGIACAAAWAANVSLPQSAWAWASGVVTGADFAALGRIALNGGYALAGAALAAALVWAADHAWDYVNGQLIDASAGQYTPDSMVGVGTMASGSCVCWENHGFFRTASYAAAAAGSGRTGPYGASALSNGWNDLWSFYEVFGATGSCCASGQRVAKFYFFPTSGTGTGSGVGTTVSTSTWLAALEADSAASTQAGTDARALLEAAHPGIAGALNDWIATGVIPEGLTLSDMQAAAQAYWDSLSVADKARIQALTGGQVTTGMDSEAVRAGVDEAASDGWTTTEGWENPADPELPEKKSFTTEIMNNYNQLKSENPLLTLLPNFIPTLSGETSSFNVDLGVSSGYKADGGGGDGGYGMIVFDFSPYETVLDLLGFFMYGVCWVRWGLWLFGAGT